MRLMRLIHTSTLMLKEFIGPDIPMYNWYRNSTVCYTYLADVEISPNHAADLNFNGEEEWKGWEYSFRRSRWFKRGWTLQELIAPSTVQFNDKDWTFFASKDLIASEISVITGIPTSMLDSSEHTTAYYEVRKPFAAEIMSWASRERLLEWRTWPIVF
jgi:hypothetical protein